MRFSNPKSKKTDREFGQALPEYALTLALITVFCVAALVAFGQDISQFLLGFAATISGVQTTPQG